VGLPATHVGHAVVESGAERGNGPAFRRRHRIEPTAPLLCLLPGSRSSETARLLPVFDRTVRLLDRRHPGLRTVIPTVDTVAEQVARAAERLGALVVRGRAEKYDAFAAADVALAASGTVALELALAGLPAVITYKVSPLTALIGRRLLRLRHVSLVNILLDRQAVPELLQEDCTGTNLASALLPLLADTPERRAQLKGLALVPHRLALGDKGPSEAAADIVLRYAEAGRKGL